MCKDGRHWSRCKTEKALRPVQNCRGDRMISCTFSRALARASLFLVISVAGVSAEEPNLGLVHGTADYALINGKIYTMDESQPWVEAVAI